VEPVRANDRLAIVVELDAEVVEVVLELADGEARRRVLEPHPTAVEALAIGSGGLVRQRREPIDRHVDAAGCWGRRRRNRSGGRLFGHGGGVWLSQVPGANPCAKIDRLRTR
jgi:hypothetical protein